MGSILSKSARRFGVIANYLSLLLFATIFCIGEYGHWNPLFVGILILALFVIAASLYGTLIKTDIWRLTHTEFGKLDEREVEITHTALRYSYALITAFSLLMITIMTFSVRFSIVTLTHRGHYSFGLVVMITVMYLIETLPAAIIAWTEERVGGQ